MDQPIGKLLSTLFELLASDAFAGNCVNDGELVVTDIVRIRPDKIPY